MWMKCTRVLGYLTFTLMVVYVLMHGQDKQWLWEILEVALEMGFRISRVHNGSNDSP